MVQLEPDERLRCASCGTELVVDNLNNCPKKLPCPWCGELIVISDQEPKRAVTIPELIKNSL